jgi:hypothetical protein
MADKRVRIGYSVAELAAFSVFHGQDTVCPAHGDQQLS